MPRSQFVSNRFLLLFLLLIVVPIAAIYTNQSALMLASLFIGAVLFVWKWRWWWDQLRTYVEPDEKADQ